MLQVLRSPQSYPLGQRKVARCSGISHGLRRQIKEASLAMPRHDLHLAWEPGEGGIRPVVLCMRCGSYSSGTSSKLTKGCVRDRNPRALHYLAKRKHPTTGKPLERLRKLDDDKVAKLHQVTVADLGREQLTQAYHTVDLVCCL